MKYALVRVSEHIKNDSHETIFVQGKKIAGIIKFNKNDGYCYYQNNDYRYCDSLRYVLNNCIRLDRSVYFYMIIQCIN